MNVQGGLHTAFKEGAHLDGDLLALYVADFRVVLPPTAVEQGQWVTHLQPQCAGEVAAGGRVQLQR